LGRSRERDEGLADEILRLEIGFPGEAVALGQDGHGGHGRQLFDVDMGKVERILREADVAEAGRHPVDHLRRDAAIDGDLEVRLVLHVGRDQPGQEADIEGRQGGDPQATGEPVAQIARRVLDLLEPDELPLDLAI